MRMGVDGKFDGPLVGLGMRTVLASGRLGVLLFGHSLSVPYTRYLEILSKVPFFWGGDLFSLNSVSPLVILSNPGASAS